MGNRGRILQRVSSTDNRWKLVEVTEENKPSALSQSEQLDLEDKLFKFDMNLKGTFNDDNLRNEEVIINEN